MNAAGRVAAVTTACRIFDRFAIEPAPLIGSLALKPLHDVLAAALAESDPQPRYTALKEISKFWVWIPGRSLTPAEEQSAGRVERRDFMSRSSIAWPAVMSSPGSPPSPAWGCCRSTTPR